MLYCLGKVLLIISSFYPIEANSDQVSYKIHANQQFQRTSVIVYKKAPTSLVKVFNN